MPLNLSTHNPSLPECRRLTKILQAVCPGAVCCWHAMARCYEIWQPSKTEGLVLAQRLLNDAGKTLHPDVYPELILRSFAQGCEPPDVQALLDYNACRLERSWRHEMEDAGEAAKYCYQAISQELSDSAPRWSPADVQQGLRSRWT